MLNIIATKDVIVSGHQPCLLYYVGFWNKLWLSDIHFIADDLPATQKDHTNRFKVKSPANKPYYYTVPVKKKNGVIINQIELSYDHRFERKMKKSLKFWYTNSSYFNDIFPMIENVFEKKFIKLVDFNLFLFYSIIDYLGISKKFYLTSNTEFTHFERKEKIAVLTKKLGGTAYLSGMGGYKYIDASPFQKHGVKLYFQEVTHAIWKQMHSGAFIEYLSILDLLFNEGPNSLDFIKNSGYIKKNIDISNQ